MTLPRKGSRPLVVGEERYRWYIRRKPTYWQATGLDPMWVMVQREGAPGLLEVDVGVARPDNWLRPHRTAVTPRMMAAAVRAAKRKGWRPEEPGVFRLSFPTEEGEPV